MVVVSFGGMLYGPFDNAQQAEAWRRQQPSDNPHAGQILALHPAKVLTAGELQERMCFPRGRDYRSEDDPMHRNYSPKLLGD
jgi:hypothetical protein